MNSSTSSSKRFFWGFVIVFLLGSAVFVLGSEYIIRTIVAPKSNFDAMRERLFTTQKPYAAFADSRGAHGLLAQTNFDNFSMASDNLATILEKANYFAQLGFAKGIIIQADPHHFASYRLNSDQSALRDDLFKRKTPWFQFLRPVYRQYLLDYWQAVLRAPALQDKPKPSKPDMIRLSDQDGARVAITASIRANLQTPIASFSQTKFASLYAKAIQGFQVRNINVCLVSFPISRPYRQAALADPAYANAMRYYATFGKQSGVKYLDLTSMLDDTQFSDPDHLNAEGAGALSQIVLKNCFGLSS